MLGLLPLLTHFHSVVTLAASPNRLATFISVLPPLPTRFQPADRAMVACAGVVAWAAALCPEQFRAASQAITE